MKSPVAVQIGTVRTMPDIIDVYRERIAALGIRISDLDDAAKLPDGYCNKMLAQAPGPKNRRYLGPLSFAGLNDLLGITFIAVVDTSKDAKLVAALGQKKSSKGMLERLSSVASRRLIPLLASDMGRQGAAAWHKKRKQPQYAKMRKRIAKNAARARWAKLRRELATSCA